MTPRPPLAAAAALACIFLGCPDGGETLYDFDEDG